MVQIETFSHRRGAWLVDAAARTSRLRGNAGARIRRARRTPTIRSSSPSLPQPSRRASIVGCSSAGEIHSHLVADDTLGRRRRPLRAHAGRHGDVPSRGDERLVFRRHPAGCAAVRRRTAAGARLLRRSRCQRDRAASRASSEALPKGTLICGGLAADGDQFERTWVLVGGVAAQRLRECGRTLRSARRRRGLAGRLGQLRPRAQDHARRRQRPLRARRQARAGALQDLPGRARCRPAPARRCCFRWRCATSATTGASVVRTILARRRGDAIDDLRRRHAEGRTARGSCAPTTIG